VAYAGLKSGKHQHLWRHFGDTPSQGTSAICRSRNWGHLMAYVTLSEASVYGSFARRSSASSGFLMGTRCVDAFLKFSRSYPGNRHRNQDDDALTDQLIEVRNTQHVLPIEYHRHEESPQDSSCEPPLSTFQTGSTKDDGG